MAQSYFLKSFNPSVRSLIRPMLLISLAIHGVLLFTPLSFDQSKPKPEPKEEETVSLTQLPPVNQPAAQPSPSTRPSPRPRPTVAVPRFRTAAPRSLRRSAPPLTRSSTPVQPVVPAAPSAPPNSQFLADLAYPGWTRGSFGLPASYDPVSHKTNDNGAAVSNYYENELAKKGYTVNLVEQGARTVYQVSKQTFSHYITLIPNQSGAGTSILLSQQPLPSDLSSVEVEDIGVQTFFNDLPVATVDPNNNRWQQVSEVQQLLSDPAAFFSNFGSSDNGFVIEPTLRSEIRRAIVGVGQAPDSMFQEISNKLEIAAYTVAPMGTYGGGNLYEVSREETNNSGQPTTVKGYISIVPSASGQDTVIFVWENRPPQ